MYYINFQRRMKNLIPTLLLFALMPSLAQTQNNSKIKSDKDKQFAIAELDKNFNSNKAVARDIWGYAELGYLETKSSGRLQEVLRKEGFTIETGVAEIPTAFVATYGSGSPVIGILAEFDALPGLSQDSVPFRKPILEGAAGHGCGHNLFGAASTSAAVALKNWLANSKKQGTIKLIGTPAEESGAGKVYLVRAGVFDNIDAVLHWHPADHNQANAETCLAFKQGRFRFYGVAAHAAANPDAGRSSLDAVESMDYMVNMMREHVPQETRIQYVITKGGLTANIVPDFAEVEYIIRHPDVKMVEKIWDRVVKCAEGAALGTETNMKYEVLSGHYNILPVETLSKLMYSNLQTVGGVNYSPAETEFAAQLQKSFLNKIPPLSMAQTIEPYNSKAFFFASSDVGDISWIVPTVGLGVATWVPGSPAHSWQSTSTGGMSIGFKAMLNASKVLSMTAIDLFNDPTIIKRAKDELVLKRGADFKYKAILGDRKPPLDYRKGL
jgi:aminobenzoyl-glutamate utilization protein B